MTLNALQALTWSTVTGAVVGALLLASVETNFSDSRGRRAETPQRSASTELTAQRKAPERSPALIETSVRREVSAR